MPHSSLLDVAAHHWLASKEFMNFFIFKKHRIIFSSQQSPYDTKSKKEFPQTPNFCIPRQLVKKDGQGSVGFPEHLYL